MFQLLTSPLHSEPYDAWRWAEELFSRRDYLGAAEYLEALLENPAVDQSHLPQVRELLVRSYYHSARLQKAAAAARRALADEPSNGYLHLLLARSLERAGEDEAASTHHRIAEALGQQA